MQQVRRVLGLTLKAVFFPNKVEEGWYLLFRNILIKEKLPSHVKMSTLG